MRVGDWVDVLERVGDCDGVLLPVRVVVVVVVGVRDDVLEPVGVTDCVRVCEEVCVLVLL